MAVKDVPAVEESRQGFAELGVNDELLRCLSELGYEEPTPIQREAIPPLLGGARRPGQAPTGTGKTAAFALPMLQRIAAARAQGPARRSALVLVPTRELAMQVARGDPPLRPRLDVRVLPIYGGQAIGQQLRPLRAASTSSSPRRGAPSTTSAAGR